MTSTQSPMDVEGMPIDGEPIRLLAIVNTLLKRRWTIILLSAAATGAGVVSALLATPSWTSTAKFLPSRTAGMTSRMSAIVGSNIDTDLGEESSSDYYVALVQSPAFLAKIVGERFEDGAGPKRSLVEIFGATGETDRERAVRATDALGKSITIAAAKGIGAANAPRIVTLTVNAATGELAAEIAAAILKEIEVHNDVSRGSKAKQNRAFVEDQLKKTEQVLDAATDALANFSAHNRKIATPALQAELDRLARAVRVQEEVFVTLTKQLELARIEEQESRVSIEILQPPEAPITRSSPKRTQMVLVAGFLGVMGSSLLVIVLERLKRADPSDPDTQEFHRQLGGVKRDLRRMVFLPRE